MVNTMLDPLQTTSFHNLQTMVAAFAVLQRSEEWMRGDATWNLTRPVATECALYLCANKYRAERQNDNLKKSLVSL